MTYSLTLPAGIRFTLLPPGTSEGAKTNPDCYRVARRREGSGLSVSPMPSSSDVYNNKRRREYQAKKKARA